MKAPLKITCMTTVLVGVPLSVARIMLWAIGWPWASWALYGMLLSTAAAVIGDKLEAEHDT